MDKLNSSKRNASSIFRKSRNRGSIEESNEVESIDKSKKSKSKNIDEYSDVSDSDDEKTESKSRKTKSNEDEDEEEEEDEEDEDEPDDEDEQEEVSPKESSIEISEETPSSYEYAGETYTMDSLPKNIENINPTDNYVLNVCIYKCVRKGVLPYLLFLMVEESGVLVFPRTPITPGKEDEDDDETQQRILEIFKQQLFDIYPPGIQMTLDTDEPPTDIFSGDLVKGISVSEATVSEATVSEATVSEATVSEATTKNIIILYDSTRVNVPLSQDKTYHWVSPYEMFTSKKVNNIPINAAIIKSEGKAFYHLRKQNGEFVPDPYVLFLCKGQEDASFFSFSSAVSFEGVEVPENTVQISYPRVKHPKLGNYTFFSSFPLSDSVSKTRYAVFVDADETQKLLTVEPDDSDILENIYGEDQRDKYSAITFMTDQGQFWCVKSPVHFSRI